MTGECVRHGPALGEFTDHKGQDAIRSTSQPECELTPVNRGPGSPAAEEQGQEGSMVVHEENTGRAEEEEEGREEEQEDHEL